MIVEGVLMYETMGITAGDRFLTIRTGHRSTRFRWVKTEMYMIWMPHPDTVRAVEITPKKERPTTSIKVQF